MKSKIGFTRLKVRGIIGIFPEERVREQDLLIDVVVDVDATEIIKTDNFLHAIDYTALAKLCQEIVAKGRYQLIETLCGTILTRILSDFNVERAHVKVHKPSAIPEAESTWCEMSGEKKA